MRRTMKNTVKIIDQADESMKDNQEYNAPEAVIDTVNKLSDQ